MQTWRDRAACRSGTEWQAALGFPDPKVADLWFPAGNSYHTPGTAVARRICDTECPVNNECLTYALEHGIKDGIWGGLDPTQRDRIRRRQRRTRAGAGEVS